MLAQLPSQSSGGTHAPLASQTLPSAHGHTPPQPSSQRVPSQSGAHSHFPEIHVSPSTQSPQCAPQRSPQRHPSDTQLFSSQPASGTQAPPASSTWPSAHGHVPPQPSAPPALPSQIGTQLHASPMHDAVSETPPPEAGTLQAAEPSKSPAPRTRNAMRRAGHQKEVSTRRTEVVFNRAIQTSHAPERTGGRLQRKNRVRNDSADCSSHRQFWAKPITTKVPQVEVAKARPSLHTYLGLWNHESWPARRFREPAGINFDRGVCRARLPR